MGQEGESGVSEIVSTVLVVILVVALTFIVGAIFLGWAIPLQKTAYIITQATPVTITNASVVQVFMSQGEAVSLYPAVTSGLPVKFSLTNGSATYNFVPLPRTASQGWKPGTSLILFRNTSGPWVADSTASVQNNIGFSNGTWTVNIIDATSNTLIAQHNVDLIGSGSPPAPFSPPVANFIGTPQAGNVPLTVQFTDTSTGGTPTAWSWNFGDGNTSTLQSPNNSYSTAGTYTVSLKATNGAGNNTQVKTGYINATQPGFTIEAWVKWNSTPNPGSDSTSKWATIYVDGTTTNNRRYQLEHDQNNTMFEFVIGTASTPLGGTIVQSLSPPVMSGTWYHVAGVYNQTPGTMAIYVNGIQKNLRTGVGNSDLRTSQKKQLGGPDGINWPGVPPAAQQRKLNGSIYGNQTYEYALGSADIQTHYNLQGHPA